MPGEVGERPIFALRLKQARERLGISQVELGRRVGMDQAVASPRINQYESGVHVPHHTTAERVAKILGVPVAYLYAEDDQLARWILAWSEMTPTERKRLLRQAEATRKQP